MDTENKVVEPNTENGPKPAEDTKPAPRQGQKPQGRKPQGRRPKEKKEFDEVVVSIGRITKVVKGGRRFRFNALVVIGNHKGKVGMGTGKANEVPDAIQKAIKDANKNLITIPRVGTTIPHEIIGKHGAGSVLIKPAPKGTGIIAGGAVRPVLELGGVNDVVSKSLGTNTKINMVRATFDALNSLRTKESVAELRDIEVSKLS